MTTREKDSSSSQNSNLGLPPSVEALHQWQPIQTAPKDERRVLLFNPDENMGGCGIQIGAYYEQLGGWQYDGQSPSYSNAHQPSHWMLLPEHPSALPAVGGPPVEE